MIGAVRVCSCGMSTVCPVGFGHRTAPVSGVTSNPSLEERLASAENDLTDLSRLFIRLEAVVLRDDRSGYRRPAVTSSPSTLPSANSEPVAVDRVASSDPSKPSPSDNTSDIESYSWRSTSTYATSPEDKLELARIEARLVANGVSNPAAVCELREEYRYLAMRVVRTDEQEERLVYLRDHLASMGIRTEWPFGWIVDLEAQEPPWSEYRHPGGGHPQRPQSVDARATQRRQQAVEALISPLDSEGPLDAQDKLRPVRPVMMPVRPADPDYSWPLNTLRKALQDDPDYAWSWHCNIAMAFYDVGGDRTLIDKAATLFMQRTFGVTTEKHPGSKK